MNKFLRNVGFYLLIILVAISIIDYFSVKNTTKQEIGYTEFLQKVDKGEVAKVTLINNMIRGTLSDGTEFTTITPNYPNNDPGLYDKLQAKNL
ncbi:MAG: ATP-dependent metallopeptidase FtsH/Yme1/Tma family protein, partial [Selenomonadaceae bacterium]|nr:ATP-dependent metallopeptidase FtsH/Yme1/Tma family protein [Selenomonadaceae bacterium]